MSSSLGDYDRWKTDPDWGMRDGPEEYEGDEEDTECIGDDCLNAADHVRSECFTAEMCEQAEHEVLFNASRVISDLAMSALYNQSIAIRRMREHVLADIDLMVQAARTAIGLSITHDCHGQRRNCNKLVHSLRCEDEPGHEGECFALPF